MLLAGCERAVPPPNPPRLVSTHIVRFGTADDVANYPGEIRPRHEVTLSFRVGGKLTSRPVENGDRVHAGQVLARLDPADTRLGAEAAQAGRSAAASDLLFATADLARHQDLFAKKFISATAMQAKEAVVNAAQGRLDAATAQAALAANQGHYAVLSAESRGVVSAVLAEAGQVVAAGQPVLRLALAGEKEVLIAVPESRLSELAEAGPIAVSLWAKPGREYAGRVREVASMADPLTRTYPARVAIADPDDEIRLGMSANLRFARKGSGTLAIIPAAAIFHERSRPAVWVVSPDGTVALRAVEVDQFRHDGAAIRAGLKDGERIIASGAHKLTAGERVRPTP